MDAHKPIYGLMAEFDDVTTLVKAAERTTAEGYKKVDAFTPFPVHELFHALDANDKRLPLIVLLAGITGAFAGFGLCYWVSAIAYPLNIGGRPFNSWPSFIPVTFEVTILFAAFTAVIGIQAGQELYGLPPMLIGYEITFAYQHMKKPPSPPRMPPTSTMSDMCVRCTPMASDNSSTGYGEKASILL